jgi:hypothetical protein
MLNGIEGSATDFVFFGVSRKSGKLAAEGVVNGARPQAWWWRVFSSIAASVADISL